MFNRSPEGKKFNPAETELPHEREVKLADFTPEYQKKLIEAGAQIKVPRRLLQDTRFRLPVQEKVPVNFDLPQEDLHQRTSHAKLAAALRYAGFSVTEPGLESVFAVTGYEFPKYDIMVRLRHDNLPSGAITEFTVKGPKEQSAGVKDAPELDADFIEGRNIIRLLEKTGFAARRYFEKYRTTMSFNDCVFVVDQCPIPEINPWAEVEGKTSEQVIETAELIRKITGYQGAGLVIGQTEFVRDQIKQKRIPGWDLNDVRFPSGSK